MSRRRSYNIIHRSGLVVATTAAVLLLVTGCGGSANRPSGALQGDGAQPVQLGRNNRTAQNSVLVHVDEPAIRRAIENLRIGKKRAAGPVQIAGADLNGDGQPEAMVLFAGKDWCANTGCSLAVFGAAQHGYKLISRTVRVKAPVVVSPSETNGWRDLLVSTGGAGTAPLRRVRLRFSGNGYSRNAMLEEEIPPDVPQVGEVAIR